MTKLSRPWVVAHQRACKDCKAKYIQETTAVQAFWTYDGAERAKDRVEDRMREFGHFNPGDKLIVRRRRPRDFQ